MSNYTNTPESQPFAPGDVVTLAPDEVGMGEAHHGPTGTVTHVQHEGPVSWLMEEFDLPHVWVLWEGAADALPYIPEALEGA